MITNKEQVIALYKQGHSCNKIARAVGISEHWINKLITSEGIMRDPAKARVLGNKMRDEKIKAAKTQSKG